MPKSKSIFILVGVLVIAAGIIHYQYRFYRTPAAINASTNAVDHIVSGGATMDGLPAINEPAFESVAAADQYLDDNGSGVMIERGGRYRFYPFQILVWHMIVNDVFGGDAMAITYDPLSEVVSVFERTLSNEVGVFTVSGKLYNSNLLMHEAISDSLWSQALGQPIVEEKTDVKLVRVPSLTTTWKQFKRVHPNSQVLSRQTGAVRDYTQNPYAQYQSSHATWFPVSHHDDRLNTKEMVFGYDGGDAQKAYTKDVVREKGTITDEVGGEQIVVYWDADYETVRGLTLIDEQPIIMTPSYWFVWAAMYPKTAVFLTP